MSSALDRLRGRVRRYGSLVLQAAVHALVARLTRAVGRDDDLWVFGARGGEAFGENTKYLFLHVAAEHPDVRAVWITRDPDIRRALRERGYEAHLADSRRGRLLQLRAGVVCLSHNFGDVDPWTVGGALTVMLWHGIPLKRISWDAELRDLPWPVSAASRSLFRRYDVVTGTSEATLAPMVSGFMLPYDRFTPIGYPRTDALFGDAARESADAGAVVDVDPEGDSTAIPDADLGVDENALARLSALDGPVALYVPTFRENPQDRAMTRLDDAALVELDALCARRDAHLALKPHPAETLDADLDPYPRLHRLPERCDVYPLLSLADVLVTDYSSVYFEFLLLDRPIVFYPYDLERYRERRGLYYDYDAVTPGPTAEGFDALRAALDRALAGEDDHGPTRKRVRERFFDAPTPGRSAAVAALVRRRLHER